MINDRLFVLPCYFDGSNNAIFESTNSILKYYKNPSIVVIDSDSPDKTYFKKLKSKSIEVINAKNRNYEAGAYWIGYNEYNNFNNYYFIHDSVKFKKELLYFEKFNFSSFRYFYTHSSIRKGYTLEKRKDFKAKLKNFFKKDSEKTIFFKGFDNFEQQKWSILELKKTNYFLPKIWLSLFGSMSICKNKVMKKLKENNFNKILPTNKNQSMAMERLFGIALQQEGYDLSNSVQGDHSNNPLNTSNFEKIKLNRK